MKYYVIYYFKYDVNNKRISNSPEQKKDDMVIKACFKDEHEAIGNLVTVALEYIRELEGTKQAEIALQSNKTEYQIANDISLKEGLYLKEVNNVMYLYEKKRAVLPGWVFDTYGTEFNKIGQFGITMLHTPTDNDFKNKFIRVNVTQEVVEIKKQTDPVQSKKYNMCIDQMKEKILERNKRVNFSHSV